MPDSEIWELVNIVGFPEHLAVVEGIERKPDDPVSYANGILEEAEWPLLTSTTFKATARKLVEAGILVEAQRRFALTDRGREAVELWLYWPSKKPAQVTR